MKVLFVTGAVPRANSHSGFIVIHQRIQKLMERGHDVGLAAFTRGSDADAIAAITPSLMELETVPMPGQSLRQKIDTFFGTTVPYDFSYVRSLQMQKLLGQMVERSHYDVVIAEFAQMGQHLYKNPYLPAVRKIISSHTCYTSAAIRRLKVRHWNLASIRTFFDLPRLHRYEFAMYRSVDHVVTLTREDAVELHNYAPDLYVSTSPYGVDVDHYYPDPSVPQENALVYTGYFAHQANRDAVRWLTKEMWPKLRRRYPNLKLYLVGREPTRWMTDLPKRDGRITVTGDVPDVAEYLRKAKIFICPLRMGRGLKGKVLQAMACGLPVVSTTVGAEGITAQSGQSILLGDTSHTMIENVDLLLQDAHLRESMARKGRELAESKYSWDKCVDKLEEVLYHVSSVY